MTALEALPTPGSAAYRSLVTRTPVPDEVRVQTQALLLDVQKRGDAALLDLTERFDGVRLQQTAVSTQAMRAALDGLDPGLRGALDVAAANIEAVHGAQRFHEEPVDVVRGVRVWREWRALRRVGLYVPGGRTVYPSSSSCSPSRPASPAARRSSCALRRSAMDRLPLRSSRPPGSRA